MSERVIKLLPNMAKLILAIVIMVISMAFFIASINKAMAATPKQNVVVTGENITLGDVFDDVGSNEDYVLAPAPLPHVTLVWDAATLNRIARAFKFSYRAGPTEQIQITRMANIITESDIENAIISSLESEGMKGHFDLDFVGTKPQIILPQDIEPTVTVLSSSFNASRQTFSATLKTADGQSKHFTGMAHALVPIPVLSTPARRDDIISKNMVTTIDIRTDLINDDMVVSMDELVGMTPRKILGANTPVLMSELNKPVMVKRGDLVTMQLKNGPIAITALAKAMESGTKGDTIRLMNMDSKKTLEARITGLREAAVYN